MRRDRRDGIMRRDRRDSAGFVGVLGERRFSEPLEGLQAFDIRAISWVCAEMLSERGLG